MLFEFCMNFLNIEKCFFCFFSQYFKFFFAFHAISNIKKKIGVKKKFRGGRVFFCRKTILSHFTFYAIFNIKNFFGKSSPSLTG